MAPREAEDLLTEEQKISLQAHVHEFRHGNREAHTAIVRKLVKAMHTDETLPLKQTKIRQAVKNWFFNRGKKPENIKQFHHRGYSAQDVFNRACREKITNTARAAMGAPRSEDLPIGNAEDDSSTPLVDSAQSLVGVRQKMLSRMFSELPSSERKRYQKIAEEWTATRAPLDVMRKRAKRYTASYTKAYAGQMYKELGVRVIIFSMQKDDEEKIKVHFHDYNGYYAGAPTFTQQRPSWQKGNVMDELDEYAEALFSKEFSTDEGKSEDGESAGALTTPTKLEYTGGFPVIPNPDALSHKEMQAVLREFLTFHYYRASGNFRGPIPWGEVVPRISDYLDECYLPRGFIFCKPDHLRVKPCATLLKHLLSRQVTHGAGPDTFAWKCFAQKTKGGAVVPVAALISFDRDDNDAVALPPRPKPRPARKGKRKQTTPEDDDSSDDSGMDTPPDCDWTLFDATAFGADDPESEDGEEHPLRPEPSRSSTHPRLNTLPLESDEDELDRELPEKGAGRKRHKRRLPDSEESEPGSCSPSPRRDTEPSPLRNTEPSPPSGSATHSEAVAPTAGERFDSSEITPGLAVSSGANDRAQPSGAQAPPSGLITSAGRTAENTEDPQTPHQPASDHLGSTAAASVTGPVSPSEKRPHHDQPTSDEEDQPAAPSRVKHPRLEVSASNVIDVPRVRTESRCLKDGAETAQATAPKKVVKKQPNTKRKVEPKTAPAKKVGSKSQPTAPPPVRPSRPRPPPRAK
ncbi:hypothetical protein HWV62_20630 [Athelia sp. TMB]|nr:hypothetical protein HWV62_20630 [Athelia sp. TMB]